MYHCNGLVASMSEVQQSVDGQEVAEVEVGGSGVKSTVHCTARGRRSKRHSEEEIRL